jgi:hypothetical protein
MTIQLDLEQSEDLYVSTKNATLQFPKHMSVLDDNMIKFNNVYSKDIFVIACGVNDNSNMLELFLSNGELRVISLNENERYSSIKVLETGYSIAVYEKLNELQICIGIIDLKDILKDSVCRFKINFEHE